MPNVFYSYKVTDKEAFFDVHELHHFKVLRLKIGDEIRFIDGNGSLFKGKIRKILSNMAIASIEESHRRHKEWKDRIILCLASSKWHRERLLIEKAIELGIDEIVEFESQYSVAHIRKFEKIDLLVRNAMKQSMNLFKPKIRLFSDFNDFIDWMRIQNDTKFILLDPNGERINDTMIPKGDLGLIVGPEGGFSKQELEIFNSLNLQRVKLGDRILRFETAALTGVIIFSYLKGRM
ncbi:MAG TPA: 16S rRNA (uracil(1498)-N(3))-methyltransferase [Thermotogaceae bacterium]|nr:16S rRNA (uracil(1498)-N(3))-methyltransferase [Thermotogaceae bacterium]